MRFLFTLALAAIVCTVLAGQTITIDLPLNVYNPFDPDAPITGHLGWYRIDCGDGVPDLVLQENTFSGSACPESVVITAVIFFGRDLNSTPVGPYDLGVPIPATEIPDGWYTVRLSAVDDCGGTGTLDYELDIQSDPYSGIPVCLPPARLTISCSDFIAMYPSRTLAGATDAELNAAFGLAYAIDQCASSVSITQDFVGGLNACGEGFFLRRFKAINSDGVENINNSNQLITIQNPSICDCPVTDYTVIPNEPDFRDGSYHFDWYDCDGTQNFSFSQPTTTSTCANEWTSDFSVFTDGDTPQDLGDFRAGEVVSPPLAAGTYTVAAMHEDKCDGQSVEIYQLTVTRIDGNNLGDITLTTQEEIDLFTRQWSYGSCSDIPGNLLIGDGTLGRGINNGTPISDLSGFSTIGPLSVGGNLVIGTTTDLTTLAGLEAISSVAGNIELTHNDALADISALATAADAGTTMVSLLDNPLLEVCGNPTLCMAADNGATVDLDPNNPNCDTPAQFTAACQILPVDFLSFTGRVNGKQVELNWATAREENNLGFHVERATSLRSEWNSVGFVPSESQADNYVFLDEAPATGSNFYRLRQVDVDGEESFSTIIDLTVFVDQVSVYPNPVRDELKISLPQDEIEQIRIFNAQGRELLTKRAVSTVFVATLPVGVYYVEVQATGRKPLLQRVIIAR